MPYRNDIPQATDRINASQPQLLINFQELQTIFGINHVNYTTLGAGKHNIVEFPNLGAAPANEPPPFLANEIGLYNCTNATTTIPEIYLRRNASATGYPITAKSWIAPGVDTHGWTYLPSGLLIKFGQRNQNAASITITFAGPAFVGFPYVTLGFIGNALGSMSCRNLSNVDFESYSTVFGAAIYCNYMAIGSPV